MRKYKIIKGEYLIIMRGKLSYKLSNYNLSPIVKIYTRSLHFAENDTIYIHEKDFTIHEIADSRIRYYLAIGKKMFIIAFAVLSALLWLHCAAHAKSIWKFHIRAFMKRLQD